MEKDILTLDIPKLFMMFKKLFQKLDILIEANEKLEKSLVEKLQNPSFGQLLHIQDVAKLLDVTQNTVYRYIRSGELSSIKIGNRHVFYETDVKDFLDKNHCKIRKAAVSRSLL